MVAASATVAGGVALLAICSRGLGVPFLLAALFTDGLGPAPTHLHCAAKA